MPKLEKIELSESEEFCKKLRKSVFETLADFRTICFNKAKDNQVTTQGDYEYIFGRIKMAFTIFEDFKPNTSEMLEKAITKTEEIK